MSNIRKSPSSPLLHLLGATGAAEGLFGGVFAQCFPNDAMRRRSSASAAFLLIFVFLFLLYSSALYQYSCRSSDLRSEYSAANESNLVVSLSVGRNNIIREEVSSPPRQPSAAGEFSIVDSVPILFPGWEVLLIVSWRETKIPVSDGAGYFCLYPNNETSPAIPSAVLPFVNKTTFKCELPKNNRRRLPFLSPSLVRRSPEFVEGHFPPPPPRREILWWNFLVYESVSTEDDVVLFAKGINNHQGLNTRHQDLRCVFFVDGERNISARTAVSSSVQEVFRCSHPDSPELLSSNDLIKVSLEMVTTNIVIPTVAFYTGKPPEQKEPQGKAMICAMTMVYNAGKFLKEWIIYHASVGVEKFVLYDNNSDDDTAAVVEELRKRRYDVERLTWIWPKAQEAGFSHAALVRNSSCTWMLYADVDEFVYSTSWLKSPSPAASMLPSLLPRRTRTRPVGQVSIKCNEFGPSSQRSHPVDGVTQGYTCRRRVDNRHKSVVLLDAVEPSLANAIHHFAIRESEYRWKHVGLESAVVNHYKYQAWSEFKDKFRRRVSAYVVDWTKNVNLNSQDRAPGLGFEAVEPPGWDQKFCEVIDEKLKMLVRQWFGEEDDQGRVRMTWQRSLPDVNVSSST